MFSHGKLITILQFFTDKVEDYWHILFPLISLENKRDDPYLYFYDISKKATDYNGEFDENGIYLFKGYDGKDHLHALEISQYSLACWQAWRKSNNNIWKDRAMHHCQWLIDNQYRDGSWRIEHKNPKYSDLPSPWSSAMAQGLAVSSLLRAYRYSGDNIYLECAQKACDFLELNVELGGVKRSIGDKYIYEEYPRKEIDGVLNGYISAIIGLYELAKVDKDYQELSKQNMENLKSILPMFDTGYWSLYALNGNPSSGFYHRYIITQLRSLSFIDRGDEKFNFFADKFESYLSCKKCVIKALWQKIIA